MVSLAADPLCLRTLQNLAASQLLAYQYFVHTMLIHAHGPSMALH